MALLALLEPDEPLLLFVVVFWMLVTSMIASARLGARRLPPVDGGRRRALSDV
jgi:hypothetical protein